MSDENKNKNSEQKAGEGGEETGAPGKKKIVIEVKQTKELDQEKAKRIIKISRRVMTVLILLAFGFMFLEYGCAKIPSLNDAMAPAFPGGRTVLYDRLFRYHDGAWPACGRPNANLNRKFIIMFRKKIGTRKSELFSRIIAIAGDTVTLEKGRIHVNGDEISGVEPGKIPEGKVPAFHFIVLNDNIDSPAPDSRVFGYVKAEEIYGRVVTLMPAWMN
ncbi:MAG: signal peptidase I [Planctomycetota bacterium]|nr:MAG: signal peptidase I [Planctomycetota bacterium]